MQQSAKVFDDESAAPEEIAVAGEKALVEMPRLNCLKSFDVIVPQIALLQDVLATKMVSNTHLPVVIVKALHEQMEVQLMWQKKILMRLMFKIEAFLKN